MLAMWPRSCLVPEGRTVPGPKTLHDVLVWIAEHGPRSDDRWAAQFVRNRTDEEKWARRKADLEATMGRHCDRLEERFGDAHENLSDKLETLTTTLTKDVETNGTKLDESRRDLSDMAAQVATTNVLVKTLLERRGESSALPTEPSDQLAWTLTPKQTGAAAVGGGGLLYGIVELIKMLWSGGAPPIP